MDMNGGQIVFVLKHPIGSYAQVIRDITGNGETGGDKPGFVSFDYLQHIIQADRVKDGFEIMVAIFPAIKHLESDVYFGVGKRNHLSLYARENSVVPAKPL